MPNKDRLDKFSIIIMKRLNMKEKYERLKFFLRKKLNIKCQRCLDFWVPLLDVAPQYSVLTQGVVKT